ncbi:MAG: hypothetical protein ACE15F_09930 [bacterium]
MDQVEQVVRMFEDRLVSRPGSDAWASLSELLNGASAWRIELNRRWAGREDWAAFLAWENGIRARMENSVLIRVGLWSGIVEKTDESFVLIYMDGRGFIRGAVVRREGGRWAWAEEFLESENHQAVPLDGLSAIMEAARAWFAAKSSKFPIPIKPRAGQGVEPIQEEELQPVGQA